MSLYSSDYRLLDISLEQIDLSDKLIRFSNCFVLKHDRLIEDDLWVKNGIILDGLDLFFNKKLVADVFIDVHGAVISPGFIDVQVNGGYGLDFSSPDADIVMSVYEVARRLPQTGVTSFCPTVISSSKQTYAAVLSRFQAYSHKHGCSKVLGLHMEGPFISKLRLGMHPADHIADFSDNPLKTILETYGENLNFIRMVTVAPEIPGSANAISELASRGITVSIGHTNADCEAIEQAISSGATFITHLFNAMPLFHHRKSHLLGALSSPALHVGVIADLTHVHPAALRVAESIAPGRIVLVTDANTSFGLPDGSYNFGIQSIAVTDGMAYVAGTDCLAGGTTPLNKCIRNFWVEVCRHNLHQPEPSLWRGLGEALAAASTRPALCLSLYQNTKHDGLPVLSKGCLESGAEADLTIICSRSLSNTFEPSINILSTWIDGRIVYISEKANFTVYVRDRST